MQVSYQQQTVARPNFCSGVGIHSGKQVNLAIKPAPVNHGIKFIRTDLPDKPCISAHFNKVVDTSLATVIGSEGCIVSTIEHLMASFSGLSIDNAIVELDWYEMPIMDGSAKSFTSLIKSGGIKKQDAPRCFLKIKQPIELRENGKFVAIYPSVNYKITCSIEYDHPLIKKQTSCFNISAEVFEKEISPARTFGFLHEYEYLKMYGLARGGSLDNVVVIDKDKILNPGGLRYADEFVRHKMLDCIGDFSLLGLPLIGHVKAFKSGHAFNHALLKKIFSQKDCWETLILQHP
ncbi:MAG: UDP-3-O-acyl-N-acetylglucosamine deacetylase [Deltaproteobacteria bacterium]|nr:UDP-3-O-acyl-N-acetylglucosamine deacetylase [Deltaproteobacteria bacterium]MBW2591677.1 UDP-3-O-acyl-N-acetylglucosamine deacetylase [Deltaproteobacteria bacterium]